ncbi:MAG: deoxyribodipyrimidine photo-lyase [Zetaproteobacteria bacterium]|nr:deoxyribodipyrimidine photo-lyase [Zetaproteobacteria bacterium]
MTHHQHALLIFRRDLRLEDQTALIEACAKSNTVSLAFIFDPKQIEPHPYQSLPAFAWMLHTLQALHEQLRQFHQSGLNIYTGAPSEVIEILLQTQSVDAIYLNRDYTPFSRQRDQAIQAVGLSYDTPIYWYDDALLNPPTTIRNKQQQPYQVFSAFYKLALTIPVSPPQTVPLSNIHPMSETEWQTHAQTITQMILKHATTPPQTTPGRSGALTALAHIDALANYALDRDIPSLDASSKLSVHLKFGTLSVREVYQAVASMLGPEHPLIRQLYWRDFFTHIAFHHPSVFGHCYLPQFESLTWRNHQAHFAAWCSGNTGFPIVDAGMRELLQTGYMHNRVRMITASFLVKDLHIDWRLGEGWFARHLLDYDPALNNGNWQWAASTGCDAQPWFRIFNPWRQQERFDPETLYIKRWLPHLKRCWVKTIHQWHTLGDANLHPLPIVDHAIEAKVAQTCYREATTQQNP